MHTAAPPPPFARMLCSACIWCSIFIACVHVISSETSNVLITGGTKGIGLACAKQLIEKANWNVYCASRSKMLVATNLSNYNFLRLDLCDIRSVEKFVADWGAKPLDVLVLNAGVQRTQMTRSADGFEATLATNHIGSFYLMKLLLPILKESKGGRIVIVGSGVHNPNDAGGNVGSKATLGDMQGLKRGLQEPFCMIDGGAFNGDKAYKDSKLCNVMTSLELARRLARDNSSVTCNCLNPGLIPTTGLFAAYNPLFVRAFTLLTRHVFRVAVSEEVAGERLAYMITSPDLEGVSGAYFSARATDRKLVRTELSDEAKDESKASLLWELTSLLTERKVR